MMDSLLCNFNEWMTHQPPFPYNMDCVEDGVFTPWNKGKKTGPLSESTREKMRLAKLGKSSGALGKRWKNSDETRKRKSKSAKRSWINNDERRQALIERNRMRHK
jgi:hypothetical protein